MIPAFLSSSNCLYLAREDHAKTGSAVLAVVEPKNLVTMAEGFLAAGYYLEDVSGLDAAEGAVSVYHFDHFDITEGRVTVLAVQPHDGAVFPSIAGVYQGAEWHERETRDFYGYVYEGNPNFVPLLLADNMPDERPLVKEEGKRASLLTLFRAEGRAYEVVKKAESFTLLDAPVSEPGSEPASEPEPAPAPAPKAASAPAEAAEKPVKKAAPKKTHAGADADAAEKGGDDA